jgi:outer membrane lipoprotein-sorting protein
MKKIFILFAVCISCSFFSFAQKDAKAKELLEKSSSLFSLSEGISADFTLNVKDESNQIAQSFEGNIIIKKNKFSIETPERTIYFDGQTQWVYEKTYAEVTVSEPGEQEVQTLNPASVLEMYKKGCNYKYNGEKTDVKMRKVKEITLLPPAKTGDILRIVIQINTVDFMPVFFHIFYKNKIENRIYIHTYQTNRKYPENRFIFDKKKYPDVEIIDLR